MKPVTPKQFELLKFVKKHGDPTFEEIAKHQNTQVSLIHRRVATLRKEGYLTPMVPNSFRSIKLTAAGEYEIKKHITMQCPSCGNHVSKSAAEAFGDTPCIKCRNNPLSAFKEVV